MEKKHIENDAHTEGKSILIFIFECLRQEISLELRRENDLFRR